MPKELTLPVSQFRDRRLEQEHPTWGGLNPKAAREAFGDLTTHLSMPLEMIAQAYWRHQANEDAVAQQRVAEATDEATVVAYYASTPHYLYELSYWEASLDKQAWFRVVARACRKYRLRRVLDFGGGVGGLTLYLRARGIQCDHLDVKGKTFDYAAWRFARRKLDVAMLDATAVNEWPHGSYDAIVAWDVLEHLFDLDAAVRNIALLLRKDGWLMSKSTFAEHDGHHEHGEHIHLAKHACYSDVRQFNQLLSRCGFHFLGQLKPNPLSRLLRTCGFQGAVAGVRITPRLKHGGNFLVHTRG